jgi:hypothetical protein
MAARFGIAEKTVARRTSNIYDDLRVPVTGGEVRRFEPHLARIGHYWRFVPESPHIRVYIGAYPPEHRTVWRTTLFCLSL